MKNYLLLLCSISIGFFYSCDGITSTSFTSNKHKFQNDSTAIAQFQEYKNNFLEEYWTLHPQMATEVGHHKNDKSLAILDSNYFASQNNFIKKHLDSLNVIDTFQLSYEDYMDYRIIRHELQRIDWNTNTFKEYEWNPSVYNVTGAIAFMVTENYAPLNQRLKDISERIKLIPKYYEQAKKNITNAVPELTRLAIDQNLGGIETLSKALIDSVMNSSLSPFDKSDILEHNMIAIRAIKDYAKFLEKNLPQYNKSFRIGKEFYEIKYAFEIQSEYTAEEMYKKALERASFIHGEMFKISDSLWTKYYGTTTKPTDTLALIRQILDTIVTQHVSADSFQIAIESQIPELEKFVTEKNLLYLDPNKPLVVRKEPAHLAGIAGASISAPGPYDTSGNTYYNVGTFTGWTPEKIESYLREYNHFTLQILNIHEAVPGHYTQLVYANKAPSMIKSIFGNNAMIEGWAVYTEQMMLENGYGDNAPEMWLMWYKWNLRTVYNMIIDYEIHTQDAQEDKIVEKLTREAFQEMTEATNKWKRASVTNIQLTSYYTGYEEIKDLREIYKKKKGKSFDLKSFHETFLSMGSIPVKYIKENMLSE